ncbi:MAG: adenylate cyclase [Verrucomicrobia bacterium]|nr:MAG: adenylate cyclase [Verrucomicrobiota bacterium]
MPIEIERKFLVIGEAWRNLVRSDGQAIRQGYVCRNPQRAVRIRTYGKEGFLTIKTGRIGISRQEFEYSIPFEHAHELLERVCMHPLIEKKRFRIPWREFTIEVDEFCGENLGLVVAEVELPSVDTVLEPPEWFGKEVSHDARYRNSQLTIRPYSKWKQQTAGGG